MSKPRVRFTVAIDGRVAWRKRTACIRHQIIGKKAIISMPNDVVAEAIMNGRELSVSITPNEVFNIPTYEVLYIARRAIIAVAPPDLKPLFEAVKRLKTWEDWQAYEARLTNAALEHARVVVTEIWGDRAPCPFCGDVPSPPSPSEGWAYPDGLTRHLTGSHNSGRCVVVQALMDWGKGYL